MKKIFSGITLFLLSSLGTSMAFAAGGGGELLNLKMILSGPAIFSLATFVIAYFFVMTLLEKHTDQLFYYSNTH